jgi:hypothetical protein
LTDTEEILFYVGLSAPNIIYIRAFVRQTEQGHGQSYMVV